MPGRKGKGAKHLAVFALFSAPKFMFTSGPPLAIHNVSNHKAPPNPSALLNLRGDEFARSRRTMTRTGGARAWWAGRGEEEEGEEGDAVVCHFSLRPVSPL